MFANHLYSDVEHSAHIELSPTLLKEILQALTQQVHHHHVEDGAISALLIAYVVQCRHVGLTPELMNEFGFPEEHDVLLIRDCFLLHANK